MVYWIWKIIHHSYLFMDQQTSVQAPAPSAQIPNSPPPSAPAPAAGAAKGGLFKIIAFVAAGIIVVSGGAFAGYYFLLRELPPEKVLARMTEKMAEAQSYHFESTISAAVTVPQIENPALSLFSAGRPFSLTITHNGDVSQSGSAAQGTLELSGGGGAGPFGAAALKLAYRTVDKKTYLQIGDFNLGLPVVGEGFNDSWYTIESAAQLKLNPTAAPGEVVGESANKEFLEKIQEFLTSGAWYTVDEQLPDEDVAGARAYHYRVRPNPQGIEELVVRIAQEDGESVTEQERAKFREFIQEISSDLSADVLIGKKDLYLRALRIKGSIAQEGTRIDIDLAMNFSNFNQPVTIAAPENPRPAEELMAKVLGGLFGGLLGGQEGLGALEGTAGVGLDRDNDGLSDADEERYGADPLNPDTDGDGFTDGAEVEAGYNPAGEGSLSDSGGEAETTTPAAPSVTQPRKTAVIPTCDVFEFPADQLESCTPYKCQFVHPFNREKLTREVFGIINGKCKYVEQMPNNGLMTCNYSESMRRAVAQYQRDIASSGSFGTGFSTDTSGQTSTTYTIDGREVENPAQEALNEGVCVITGY